MEPDTVDWNTVLERISNGEVPQEFCSLHYPDVPDNAAMIERRARTDSGFAARLKDAKQMGAICMLAQCKEIADRQAMRADQKKLMIDVRMKLAAIWNPAECREVTKTEVQQTTTLQTPREEYVKQTVALLGIDAQQAGAMYDRMAIH